MKLSVKRLTYTFEPWLWQAVYEEGASSVAEAEASATIWYSVAPAMQNLRSG